MGKVSYPLDRLCEVLSLPFLDERLDRLSIDAIERSVAVLSDGAGDPQVIEDAKRAGFARKHLWVTQYDEEGVFPAGEFPNQNPGSEGLPTWSSKRLEIAYQEARAVLEAQQATAADID